MKKVLSMIIALSMVAAMSVSVSAAGSFDPGTQEDKTITSDQGDKTTPVYGYVGGDAEIEDTNPTNPDTGVTPGTPDTTISVRVPVKILWAAFASDGGTVTSPSYEMENNSAMDLKVKLVSFTATGGADNTAVDSNLTLNLTGTELARSSVLTPANHNYEYTSTFEVDDIWGFGIGGTYTGSFAAQKLPTYDMVMSFSLA